MAPLKKKKPSCPSVFLAIRFQFQHLQKISSWLLLSLQNQQGCKAKPPVGSVLQVIAGLCCCNWRETIRSYQQNMTTKYPRKSTAMSHPLPTSFYQASLSKQQRCWAIDLNAALLVRVLARFNLPMSSSAFALSRGTGKGNVHTAHPSPSQGRVAEWAVGRSGLKTLFWFS